MLLQTFLSVNQTAVYKHHQFHLYPIEDLGGTTNQMFALQGRRKATFIKNHAHGLLAGRTSAVSLGKRDFAPNKTLFIPAL